jgi:hypothetical protein
MEETEKKKNKSKNKNTKDHRKDIESSMNDPSMSLDEKMEVLRERQKEVSCVKYIWNNQSAFRSHVVLNTGNDWNYQLYECKWDQIEREIVNLLQPSFR